MPNQSETFATHLVNLSGDFFSALNDISCDRPCYVQLHSTPGDERLADMVMQMLWQWKFHQEREGTENLIFQFDNMRLQFCWDGQISAMLGEHFPGGVQNAVEQYLGCELT